MIPTTFQLMGRTIRVVQDINRSEDLSGLAMFDAGIIRLDPAVPEDRKKQVFYHELVHFLEFHSGADLTEGQVETMGSLLQQAIDTMK